jgi:hypothetical protein
MASGVAVMLTTIDNPFSPFTQYDEWDNYDKEKGYHSSALLARVARSSEEMSDADQDLANEQAIDEIIEMNDTGLYVRARRDG